MGQRRKEGIEAQSLFHVLNRNTGGGGGGGGEFTQLVKEVRRSDREEYFRLVAFYDELVPPVLFSRQINST